MDVYCPCCLICKISRTESGTWERGHIIPTRNLGPDIYANIRPICVRCNEQDKKFETNYHYMVHIGTMQPDDLNPALARIRHMYNLQEIHPERFQCRAVLGKIKSKRSSKSTKLMINSKEPIARNATENLEIDFADPNKHVSTQPTSQIENKCKNARLPRSIYCGVHKNHQKKSRTTLAVTTGELIENINATFEMRRVWDFDEIENFKTIRAQLIDDILNEDERSFGYSGIPPF